MHWYQCHLTDNFELQRVNLFLSPLFLSAHSSPLDHVLLWHCSWWVSSGFTYVEKNSDVDTRINTKSETKSDVRRGWRLSGHAVERRFAWKIMLSQNLWCVYICAWTCGSIYERMSALCSQGLHYWVTVRSWLKAEAARRDESNVCMCFSIAMDFFYIKSFLPHQFNMEGCFWR